MMARKPPTQSARTSVRDIEHRLPRRVVVAWSPVRHIPLTKLLKVGTVIAAITFVLGIVEAPGDRFRAAAQEDQTAEEQVVPSMADGIQQQRSELEAQLAELETQIAEHQKSIESYQKQGKTLSSEISSLNTKIDKLNLQIKAVNLNLTQLERDIVSTQKSISQTEDRMSLHRDAISKAVRNLYEADREPLLIVLMGNTKLSDFFGNVQNVLLVQASLRNSLEEITKLREQLLDQKQELAFERQDTENLKVIQESQKKSVQATQNQKASLLKATKGKEAEYQKILKQTQASAAQIRSRIFELLGGGELTFEKAYDFAKLAEGATGVRAALTLAILNRESLLGKNVGRCSYKTAMHPTRDVPYFLDLTSRLGIDPTSDFAKVSCPNQHGTYGGAMGPAQFIPSTWKLYEDKIARVSGNTPPSPWNNADAFAATAAYMQDLLASASCKEYANANKNVLPYQSLLERCAAAKYYAGGRWYTYRLWYGEPVVTQANSFEKDIQVIEQAKQNASTQSVSG